MRTIVVLRPREGVTLADFQPHLLAEGKVLRSCPQSGSCRSIHHHAERPGVTVLEFETDEEEARRLTDGFPIVRAGPFDAETPPLAPYAGLAALFAPEHGVEPALPAAWTAAG